MNKGTGRAMDIALIEKVAMIQVALDMSRAELNLILKQGVAAPKKEGIPALQVLDELMYLRNAIGALDTAINKLDYVKPIKS